MTGSYDKSSPSGNSLVTNYYVTGKETIYSPNGSTVSRNTTIHVPAGRLDSIMEGKKHELKYYNNGDVVLEYIDEQDLHGLLSECAAVEIVKGGLND